MWRKNAFDLLIFPVPVFLKRLAAPLCVFSFGMVFSSLAFTTQPVPKSLSFRAKQVRPFADDLLQSRNLLFASLQHSIARFEF
jgi:hypothetical protein